MKSPFSNKQTIQIKADLYEWIRPLNAMDATLNYYLKRGGAGGHMIIMSTRIMNSPPNATNKSIFNSVSELSSLRPCYIGSICVTALHRASQRSNSGGGGGDEGDECDVMCWGRGD